MQKKKRKKCLCGVRLVIGKNKGVLFFVAFFLFFCFAFFILVTNDLQSEKRISIQSNTRPCCFRTNPNKILVTMGPQKKNKEKHRL